MCGIVGLFLKDKDLYQDLGELISEMLVKMSDRGPDSAGLAIYSSDRDYKKKITLRVNSPSDLALIKETLSRKLDSSFSCKGRGNHLTLCFDENKHGLVLDIIKQLQIDISIMSEGKSVEIFKEACSPDDFNKIFSIKNVKGSHAIGHTRMATESKVTTLGAHPFSTAEDQCLVHNGSLSNHNNVRRNLLGLGQKFETDNDSEVAAAYLSWKIKGGLTLEEALGNALKDLDGFFTFLVGTLNGFGVLRDNIACKPAVLAETDQYVAFGSEYRALTNLPSIAHAKVWEPEPGEVYFWNL